MNTESRQQLAARIIGRSTAHAIARQAIMTGGAVRTGHYTGSGRFTHAVDDTPTVRRLLSDLGIDTVTGNSAPRGGVWGNWLRIATPAESMAQKGQRLSGAAWREAELILRANQVERQMGMDPVGFEQGPQDIMPHAPIFGTERAADYHGCGPITIYLNAQGQMVAFHYGHTVMEGWKVPAGLTTRRGTASCGQTC